MTELKGRVAVVTGGGRGIGEAIAEALSGVGASVAIWDLDGGRAKEVADRLGDHAIGVEVDVTSRASVEQALAVTTEWLGPVDVLVNNAGIDKIEPFLASEEPTWERIVAVNYLGPVRCCHVVVPGHGRTRARSGGQHRLGCGSGRIVR